MTGGRLPDPILAAGFLAAAGVSFLLTGSGALWLHGEDIPVRDADAVIEPGEQNLTLLRAALAGIAVRPREVPAVPAFRRCDIVSVATNFGNVDCLLGRGRKDWHRLRLGAGWIPVSGVNVPVASAADAWKLRRRFKGAGS